jgi:hypothetical protein
MLESLITSKTRLKLLMKFFINSEMTGYLRHLSAEFGESTNGIRQELNRFEDAQLLESTTVQNKKLYKANTHHPYYKDLHALVLKYVGIERIIDDVVKRVGQLEKAYVINDFAAGNPSKHMDLVLVGKKLDQSYLHRLVRKAEENVSFDIHLVTVEPDKLDTYVNTNVHALLIWSDKTTGNLPNKQEAAATQAVLH